MRILPPRTSDWGSMGFMAPKSILARRGAKFFFDFLLTCMLGGWATIACWELRGLAASWGGREGSEASRGDEEPSRNMVEVVHSILIASGGSEDEAWRNYPITYSALENSFSDGRAWRFFKFVYVIANGSPKFLGCNGCSKIKDSLGTKLTLWRFPIRRIGFPTLWACKKGEHWGRMERVKGLISRFRWIVVFLSFRMNFWR